MYDDGYQTSHPVSVEVLTPAQINSVFDSITYDKGSSLLRMLEATVGANNFRDGLNVNKILSFLTKLNLRKA
jgi:aminopeptidase N